jgi:hypothetical protein
MAASLLQDAFMHLDKRLPHNAKEGALYGGIICCFTALYMTVFNVRLAVGAFNTEAMWAMAKYFPLMFVIAMLIEPLIVGRLAEKAMHTLSPATDSGNAKILFRMVFTVFGMSVLMTLIANAIVFGVHADLPQHFFMQWPRNFVAVLLAEALLIQPIARAVMVKIHHKQDLLAAIKA